MKKVKKNKKKNIIINLIKIGKEKIEKEKDQE